MARTLVALIMLLAVNTNLPAQQLQFEKIRGPEGGSMWVLYELSPGVLFALGKHFYLSTDGGLH